MSYSTNDIQMTEWYHQMPESPSLSRSISFSSHCDGPHLRFGVDFPHDSITSIEYNSTVPTITPRTITQVPPILQCKQCDKKFDEQWKYNRHEKAHERSFKCVNCTADFTTKRDLKRHIAAKHTPPSAESIFFCHFPGCPMNQAGSRTGFGGRRDNLRRHWKKVHNYEPNQSKVSSTIEATVSSIGPSQTFGADQTHNGDKMSSASVTAGGFEHHTDWCLSSQAANSLTHNDYTVAWICALPIEQTAAMAMLDELHMDLPQAPEEHNAYILGRIDRHNVVISCLPNGEVGSNATMKRLATTFPSLRLCLMIGIGGGVPPVRLGDVVVSTPVGRLGGLVQWEYDKEGQIHMTQRSEALLNPPYILRTVLMKLETKHEMRGTLIPQYLEKLKTNWPILATKYTKPGILEDALFQTDYGHVENLAKDEAVLSNSGDGEKKEKDCIYCDRSKTIQRENRDMRVHYGLIASSNQVIRNAILRNEINRTLGDNILCFEMEAAGPMHNFPGIVIRGICDYADSHKNYSWQSYAAAIAAAYACELLSEVSVQELGQLPTISAATSRKQPRSTVPFDRDSKFVGRQDIFTALESHFSQTSSHSRAALAGLGGVGKSQIAIEFSYRLRMAEPSIWVFWVYASTVERFEQGYRSIAAELGLPESDDTKTNVFSLVSKWLSDVNNGRWLMILDNADDVGIFRTTQGEKYQRLIPLSSYIPQTTTGSVLITTRDRKAASWLATGYENVILVDSMDPYDAGQLLSINLPRSLSTSSDLTELIRELDYLPLAITQVAAYISARAARMSVSKFLMLYRQDEESQLRLLTEEYIDSRRDSAAADSVFQTWRISFDKIKQSQAHATKLLSLIAMFDRQSIPEYLLSPQYSNLLDFEDALTSLDEFSLIKMEEGGKTFKMHRLVQLAVRLWLGMYDEAEKWKGVAINIISNAFPIADYSNWNICDALAPHAREILSYKLELNQHLLMRASLLYNMAWYNLLRGQNEIANAEGLESLTIREKLLEARDEKVFESVGMLALVLHAQSKYKEAEKFGWRALSGREKILGSKHPSTLESMSNFVLVLHAQGKYKQAEIIIREALAGRETTLGSECLTLTSMLASTYQYQGRWDEAHELCVQVMDTRKRIQGTEHSDTLRSINSLALTYRNQDRRNEAKELYMQVMDIRKRILGEEHPDTLTSITNVASIFQDQGYWKEAEKLHVKVMEVRMRVLGHEHPDTLTSMANLSVTFRNQGFWREAEELSINVMEKRTRVLGQEHRDTLTSMANVAFIRQHARQADALKLMEECVLLRTRILGTDHPDTLSSATMLLKWQAEKFED